MPAAPDREPVPQPHVHGVFASSPPEPRTPGRKSYKDLLVWPALALFIICIITTAALAGTNALTVGPIADQARLAAEEARKAVLPAATFERVDLSSLSSADLASAVGSSKSLSFANAEAYRGLDAEGKTAGVVVEVDTRGYANGLRIMIGIAADATVAGIRILADSETPGLGKKVADAPFLSGLLGKPTATGFAVRKDAKGDIVPVDAVTGATISSRAVVEAVNAAARLAALLQKGGA